MKKILIATMLAGMAAMAAQAEDCSYYHDSEYNACIYRMQLQVDEAQNRQREAESEMEEQRYNMDAQRRQSVLDADDYPIMGEKE